MSPEEVGEALRLAVKRRDLEALRGLLSGRPEAVHLRDERGRTALFHTRDLAILETLLASGAAVDSLDDARGTALLRHAAAGKAEVLELLLRHGARVEVRDRDGWTPLHAAAAFAGVAAVKLLLDRGADPLARNRHDYAPIHEALHDLNPVVARWLWEGPGPRDVVGAAALGEVVALSALLDGDPALRDVKDGRGRAPLHWAAAHGKARAAQALLARGAAPDVRDEAGETPLHAAARGVQLDERLGTASRDVALALLDGGADPSPRAPDGRTPLDLAIRANRVKPAFIALLESRGARSTAIPGEER